MTASSQECHSFFSMFFVFVVPVRMTNFLPEMTSVMPTSYGLETMGSIFMLAFFSKSYWQLVKLIGYIFPVSK